MTVRLLLATRLAFLASAVVGAAACVYDLDGLAGDAEPSDAGSTYDASYDAADARGGADGAGGSDGADESDGAAGASGWASEGGSVPDAPRREVEAGAIDVVEADDGAARGDGNAVEDAAVEDAAGEDVDAGAADALVDDGAAFDEGAATDAADASDASVVDEPQPSAAPCSEPGGIVDPASGHCYFPLGTAMSWQSASDACTAAGAHLATVTSSAEQAIVAPFAAAADSWVGYTRTGPPPATFDWVTAEPTTWTDWALGEPNELGAACARLRAPTGEWADRTCDLLYDAVCEREP